MCYLDDILVTGELNDAYLKCLEEVLHMQVTVKWNMFMLINLSFLPDLC